VFLIPLKREKKWFRTLQQIEIGFFSLDYFFLLFIPISNLKQKQKKLEKIWKKNMERKIEFWYKKL